jgi:hypothetical protein
MSRASPPVDFIQALAHPILEAMGASAQVQMHFKTNGSIRGMIVGNEKTKLNNKEKCQIQAKQNCLKFHTILTKNANK